MKGRDSRSTAPAIGVLFVVLFFAFPRTFVEVKLIVLALIIIHFLALAYSRTIFIPSYLFVFYGALIIVGFLAAFVGAMRGNITEAISDGIRLYILWGILIPLLLTYFWQFNAMLILHYGIVIAGFTTSALNLTFIVSSFAGWSVFPESFSEAMLLKVGFHDGYVQIIAHNIGMLLFIVPYLLVTALRTDGLQENRLLVLLALAVVLITTVLSGRRALWIVTIVTPLLMWVFAMATGTCNRIRAYRIFAVGSIGLLVAVIAFTKIFFSEDTLLYLSSAFSAEDERSIQKGYLIDGFLEFPIFGSGFGGLTEYVRSEESPWLYELSYHQILFNFGLVGSVLLALSFSYTFIKAVQAVKADAVDGRNGVVSVLFGTLGLLIGAYSNPYLGSFDYILALGFLPLAVSRVPK